MSYKCSINNIFMKAKKSAPKSIRFNVKDFEEGMLKGSFESAQDMVDYLLKNYVRGEDVKLNVQKTVQAVPFLENIVTEVPSEKELKNDEIFIEIQRIKSEVIPKERDTILGRNPWKIEQDAKIKKLISQLITEGKM